MTRSKQLSNLKREFSKRFGQPPKLVVSAPGRVNLIGEHTDYNLGFVLPCAINFATLVAISPRNDGVFKVCSLNFENQLDEFNVKQAITFQQTKMWANYIRGVVSELKSRNLEFSGANMAILGDVPQQAGLSSSASLEVAVCFAIVECYQLAIDKKQLALICQAAENNFVGCGCGIMDQLISACGSQNEALGIDCRNLNLTKVPIAQDLAIMIVNSNLERELVDSKYNLRRQQCEIAANRLSVNSLRDISLEEFNRRKHELPVLIANRAQHVIEENIRTVALMEALKNHQLEKVSRLMSESHDSMKRLFEITTPAIDFLVECISKEVGLRGGVRMTGGGFGGCVVAILPKALVTQVVPRVEQSYFAKTGIKESIYLTSPSGGASLVSDFP